MKNDHLILSRQFVFFVSIKSTKKKIAKTNIFILFKRDIFKKIFSFVEFHVLFTSSRHVLSEDKFSYKFFPPIKLDSNLLFWCLISLIAKLVRKINSWFHATIEIIKEPKKNIKCVTMVKHQFVFSRINNNLIVIVAGGSNNNKQLPNN